MSTHVEHFLVENKKITVTLEIECVDKVDAQYSLGLEPALCVNGGYKVIGFADSQNLGTSFYPKNLFNINEATLDFFHQIHHY